MACGCKKSARNVGSARTITPTSAQSGGSISSPVRVNALNAPPELRSPSGMNGERRKVEKVRRDAIKKALGR